MVRRMVVGRVWLHAACMPACYLPLEKSDVDSRDLACTFNLSTSLPLPLTPSLPLVFFFLSHSLLLPSTCSILASGQTYRGHTYSHEPEDGYSFSFQGRRCHSARRATAAAVAAAAVVI